MKNVLVVEDEGIVAMSIGEVLESEGYQVVLAGNGRKALDQLAAGLLPDLILLDMSMPVMNGFEFHDERLKLPAVAKVPIIIITADGDAEAKAARIDAIGFLIKPFSIDTLLDEVERVVPP